MSGEWDRPVSPATAPAGAFGDGLEAIGGFVWEHRVFLLQVAATGALIASLAFLPGAPALLAAASPSLGTASLFNAGAIGLNLLAIGQSSDRNKADQYTHVIGLGLVGLVIGGVYSSTPLIDDALGWMAAAAVEGAGALVGSSGS